jgi:hypothetical protein
MKVAFGWKAHSGWAALVVLGVGDGGFTIVDRRRVELVDDAWAKQPYHAAKDRQPVAAREVVERGIEGAHRLAVREVQAAVSREQERNNKVAACAVLMAQPMPDWSIEEILAVHFRMHKAEGVLFRDALARAANQCGLRLVAVPEKRLMEHSRLLDNVAKLGKAAGPPWGRDQKDAALAAMIATEETNNEHE